MLIADWHFIIKGILLNKSVAWCEQSTAGAGAGVVLSPSDLHWYRNQAAVRGVNSKSRWNVKQMKERGNRARGEKLVDKAKFPQRKKVTPVIAVCVILSFKIAFYGGCVRSFALISK